MSKRGVARRDRVWDAGFRASLLTEEQSDFAWRSLAGSLESMERVDVPKFRDILNAIRSATIAAKAQSRLRPPSTAAAMSDRETISSGIAGNGAGSSPIAGNSDGARADVKSGLLTPDEIAERNGKEWPG